VWLRTDKAKGCLSRNTVLASALLKAVPVIRKALAQSGTATPSR
jgi:hypothetical protein